MSISVALSIVATACWLLLLIVPWRPWSTKESLSALDDSALGGNDNAQQLATELANQITVLIPARNEADGIQRTIASVRAQAKTIKVFVINDESEDDTAQLAREAGATVISGTTPPPGWTGKLWALEQGLGYVSTPWVLQLDADIELAPGMLAALYQQRQRSGGHSGFDLISIMALLPTLGFWQRYLLPAYVWFFKLIYPFRLANSRYKFIAAAAGGCILIRRQMLKQLGGYACLKHAVIDDCSLARKVKDAGGRTWLGLSRDVISHRASADLKELADLVARTAYTQLRHSILLLLGVSLMLVLVFWVPVWQIINPVGNGITRSIGVIGYLAMCAAYIPLLRFYRLNPLDALALPAIASLYLWMTWLSAWRHWMGIGAQWKGRNYQDSKMKQLDKRDTAPETQADIPSDLSEQNNTAEESDPLARPFAAGPVFIVGSPRSGTSVLHWSLLEHPALWGSEESEFMIPMAKALKASYESGIRFGEHAWLLQQRVGYEEYCAYIGSGIDRLYRNRSKGLIWVEQTPAYSLIVEELALMFPSARFLYIQRDGRKVNESMRRMWQWDVEQAAQTWVTHNKHCLQLERAEPQRVHRVVYERMVSEPDTVFKGICEFLQLPYESSMKKYMAGQSPINVSPGTESESGQDKLKLRDTDWSQDEISSYWKVAGDMMKTLAYHE